MPVRSLVTEELKNHSRRDLPRTGINNSLTVDIPVSCIHWGRCQMMGSCEVFRRRMKENGKQSGRKSHFSVHLLLVETVINAFVHNHWLDKMHRVCRLCSDPICQTVAARQGRFFQDRLEILSRGSLPPNQIRGGFFAGESVPVNQACQMCS